MGVKAVFNTIKYWFNTQNAYFQKIIAEKFA